jgi:hypothetical protein
MYIYIYIYTGMDALILIQLFDSILHKSFEIKIKNNMKDIVKSICKTYFISVPDIIPNFLVSTVSKKSKENKILPLRAMKMKEINMAKNWEVPELN